MTTIPSAELKPGDILQYHGRTHCVSRVVRRDGWAWPVASDDAGWAIALGHDLVVVERAA